MVVNMMEHTRHNVLLAELSGCSQEDWSQTASKPPAIRIQPNTTEPVA